MKVVVIERHVVDSYSGPPPMFCAVAVDEVAAKLWIEDEVDGKHKSGHRYAEGKTADWWIQYGTFSLTPTEVYE